MSRAKRRCATLRLLAVEDEPERREELARHATGCDSCAAWAAQQQQLAELVGSLERTTAAPSARLADRVLSAVDREIAAAGRRVAAEDRTGADTAAATNLARPADRLEADRPARGQLIALPPRRWTRAGWAAAAAALVAAVLFPLLRARLETPPVISVGGRLILSEALAAAEAAEQEHARAIARLEAAAETILARAHDPATSPADVGFLLSYRERLASLDQAIAEVRSYLDTNPGLASARTVLLAAYIDKNKLLRDLIAWDEQRGV